VTVEVARSLEVPKILLVVNKTPLQFDPRDVKRNVEETYDCEVAAVVPHSDELMTLASAGVYLMRYPQSPLAAIYRSIGERLRAG
jgi:septum site-determining protein MinD